MQDRGRMALACLVITLLLVGCTGGAASTPSSSSPATAPTPTAVTPTPSLVTAAPSAPAPATVERTTAHIASGGRTRDYAVVVPSDVATRQPLPLLLFLHGRNVTQANAASMEEMAGFDALVVEPGLIVVYPEGYQNTWNAGTCCQPATTDGVDDVAFVAALVDQLEADYRVDRNRVFIGGDGTGGSMAFRAACELADRFAAVAVVSGLLLVDCSPASPIPALHIHGAEDHRGGSTTCDGLCPSVAQTMNRWRQADGCTGKPTTTTEGIVATTTYSTCAGSAEVEFITVAGEQDTWLGPEPDDRGVIWAFLTSHARSTGSTG